MLTAVISSIVMTWVCLNNERSIFSAVVFHAVINFTRSAVPLSGSAKFFRTLFLAMFAVVVALRLWSIGRVGD